jgi:2'-5' RNA ligase
VPFAVHLDLDATVDRTLADLAARLVDGADDEIETVYGLGDRHHISLAIYDQLQVAQATAALRRLALETRPLRVGLASLGLFPAERSVLFVAPVVTDSLLELHARTHRAFAPFAGAGCAYYRPGAWVPHVTVAMNLPGTAVGNAVAQLAAGWRACTVACNALRLVSFRPVEALCCFDLSALAER